MAWSETSIRAVTGAGLVAIIVASIVLGPWSYAAMLMVVLLVGRGEARHACHRAWPGRSPFVVAMLGLAMVLLPAAGLWALGWQDGEYGGYLPLGWFMLMWTNDTAAYLTGRTFGRHRIAPHISPGKTWEGWAGGLIATVIVGVAVLGTFPTWAALGGERWAMLALLVSFLGPAGDLMESALKRKAGLKDSGRLLPGHGGVLDRFDSHFLAAPCAAILLQVF